MEKPYMKYHVIQRQNSNSSRGPHTISLPDTSHRQSWGGGHIRRHSLSLSKGRSRVRSARQRALGLRPPQEETVRGVPAQHTEAPGEKTLNHPVLTWCLGEPESLRHSA